MLISAKKLELAKSEWMKRNNWMLTFYFLSQMTAEQKGTDSWFTCWIVTTWKLSASLVTKFINLFNNLQTYTRHRYLDRIHDSSKLFLFVIIPTWLHQTAAPLGSRFWFERYCTLQIPRQSQSSLSWLWSWCCVSHLVCGKPGGNLHWGVSYRDTYALHINVTDKTELFFLMFFLNVRGPLLLAEYTSFSPLPHRCIWRIYSDT